MGGRVAPDFLGQLAEAIVHLQDLIASVGPDFTLGEIVIKDSAVSHGRAVFDREIMMSPSYRLIHDPVKPVARCLEINEVPIRFSRTPGKFNIYEEVASRTGMNREYVKQLLYMSGRLPDEEQRSLDRVLAACRQMRREIPS